MSYIQQYKTFARARPWTAITVLVLLSIILLVSVVRISLPFVINYGATNWLKSQGIIASVADIEISVIDGRFSIINASGKNEAGNGFSIGRFDISWQWLPLLDNQLIINEVKINSLASDILLFENGDKNIAGLSIKAGDEAEEDASDQQPSRPWDIALNRILLSDVSFCLQQFDSKKQSVIDYCAKLSSFGWDGNIGFKPSQQIESSEIPLYVKGTLKLNNIVIHNNYLKLDLLNTKEIAVNNIAINTLTDISINSVGIDSFQEYSARIKHQPATRIFSLLIDLIYRLYSSGSLIS